ncbi:MAG TPA: hypothetical protein VKU85_08775 [bacterium]|nr:hypothetical protein [bacterium]
MPAKKLFLRGLAPAFAATAAFALAGCGDDSSMGPDPDPDPDPGGPPTYETIATFMGTGFNGLTPDGIDPLQSELSLPQDLTWGPDGKVYIMDWNNHRVRTITNGVVETVIGTGELGDAPEGPATQTRLNHPTHVSFDPQGNLILSAWHNSKVMRMDRTTRMLTTICGNGNRTFSGDGGPAVDAEVDLPLCTAWDSQGNMYLTDEASVRIRRVDTGGVISTVAGIGRPGGYSGDGGPADQAELSLPWGQSALPVGRICVHGGTLYIADTGNHIVRAVDLSTGIITTVAGTPGAFGYSGDGGLATAANLSGPADVDVDKDGNLFIADTYNHVIRKVDTSGVITTFAGTYTTANGTAVGGYGGDGGSPTEAQLNRPFGIAFDANQRLYIADTHNYRIRVVY